MGISRQHGMGLQKFVYAPTHSFTFNGTDEYLLMDDADDLSFGDSIIDVPFSATIWIKPNGLASNGIIFGKQGGSGLLEWQMTTTSGDKLKVTLYDNSGANVISSRSGGAADDLVDGFWYFCAITYDGSSLDTGLNIWVNGIQTIPNVRATSGTYVAMHNLSTDVSVAAGALGAATAPMKGTDAIIFNIELTTTHLTSLYNGGVPNDPRKTVPASNIVSWMQFNGDDDVTGTAGGVAEQIGSHTIKGVNMDGTNITTDVPS